VVGCAETLSRGQPERFPVTDTAVRSRTSWKIAPLQSAAGRSVLPPAILEIANVRTNFLSNDCDGSGRVATGLSLSEEFIALFNNLKEAAGNSPERVAVFYKDSKAIRDALHALWEFLARTDLERRVFHGQKQFILRAAGFEAAWQEYDEKWRFRVIWPELPPLSSPELPPLSSDEIAKALALLDADVEPDPSPAQKEGSWRGEQVEAELPTAEGEPRDPDPEFDDSFDPVRHDGGAAIELGIWQLDEMAWNEPSDHAKNRCRLALGAYDYLIETIGLNVHNVFRRWRKVPVVFMPAHVSNLLRSKRQGLPAASA
jgi:hypothetical protein